MRDTHRQFLPLAITLVWLAAGVHAAAAEWFADLYGGAAFTQSSHFSLDGQIDGVAVAGVVDNIRYDTSFSVGARGGYWFESFKFFGLGLDVDHFRPDISSQTATGHGTITDSQDVLFGVPINGSGLGPVKLREVDLYITAFAFDLMFRWPMLAGPNFPMGQLQPDRVVHVLRTDVRNLLASQRRELPGLGHGGEKLLHSDLPRLVGRLHVAPRRAGDSAARRQHDDRRQLCLRRGLGRRCARRRRGVRKRDTPQE